MNKLLRPEMGLDKHFKKIAFAITFSPRLEDLLSEAVKMQGIFSCEMIFIHVGEVNEEKEEIFSKLFSKYHLNLDSLIWDDGHKINTIIDICEKQKIDLLVAGAIPKENLIRYYVGSVARQIIRRSGCSVLLLNNPNVFPHSYSKIGVNLRELHSNEKLASIAFSWAKSVNASKVYLIKEAQLARINLALNQDLTEEELRNTKEQVMQEEEEVFDEIIQEFQKQIPPSCEIQTKLIFGKTGVEIRNFAEENNIELLIMRSSKKRISIIDRIFQHGIEYLLEDLPSDLLVIRE